VQHGLDFIGFNFQAFIQAVDDFLDAGGQVAGIIDGVNNCIGALELIVPVSNVSSQLLSVGSSSGMVSLLPSAPCVLSLASAVSQHRV
jgi:hypothetical protein